MCVCDATEYFCDFGLAAPPRSFQNQRATGGRIKETLHIGKCQQNVPEMMTLFFSPTRRFHAVVMDILRLR